MSTLKAELRVRFSAARRAMSAESRAAARAAIRAQVLDRCARAQWRCVAAYEPFATEPGSTELLSGFTGSGVRVLVPVTLPDRDLDWRAWRPDGTGSADGTGVGLGTDAVGAADAVLVPALAVAMDGTRLGRGGGSYDRALGRLAPDALVAALLFDDELVAGLPAEPWDRPVHEVVRPGGWTVVGGSDRNTRRAPPG